MGTYALCEIMGTCCLSVQIYRIGMTMSELEGAQQTWTENYVSVVRNVESVNVHVCMCVTGFST